MKINTLKSSVDFMQELDSIVIDKDIDYYEAVLHYMQSNDIEIETLAFYIKQIPTLKAKIQIACESLNLVEKSAKLPI